MDVDELNDELVDYEEDAMMTDAADDAGGEVDMEAVEEEDHDGDEEMSNQAENAPEMTTESVAMTPLPVFNNPDEMQDGAIVPDAEIDLTSAEWPPAPTSVPAVPSRLPEASLIPPAIQHEEGRLLPSELNSIAAEPPASPTRTVTSIAVPGMSRPPSPPVVLQGDAGRALDMTADVTPEVKIVTEGSVDLHPAVDTVGEAAPVVATSESLADEMKAGGVEVADKAAFEEDVGAIQAPEVIAEDGQAFDGSEAGGPRHEESVHPTEATDTAVSGHPSQNDEHQAEPTGHDDPDHHTDHHDDDSDEYDEETGEPKFSPIVIEIVANALRPLFFPLSEENAASTERMTRPNSDDWETEPYHPLLPGMADELYNAPLRDVFVALRAVLGEEWDESRGTEMILHERSLGLKIGEDNKYTDTLSLHDLVDLYNRCNCYEPMILSIEYDSVRFIAKYNAIKKVLDSSAAPPDVDSSSEEEEQGEGEDYGRERGEAFGNGGFGFAEADGGNAVDTDELEHIGSDRKKDLPEEDFVHPVQADGHALPDSNGSADAALQAVASPSAAASTEPSKGDTHANPEMRGNLTTVPLPTKPSEHDIIKVAGGHPIADTETDELEHDGDDGDDVSEEGSTADTYGIDAAVKSVESVVETVEATSADIDRAAVNSATPDGSQPADQSENGLKRALSDEAASDSERSVKRKLGLEPPAD